MKFKVLIFTFLLAGIPLLCNAQEKPQKFEFRFGWGGYPMTDNMNATYPGSEHEVNFSYGLDDFYGEYVGSEYSTGALTAEMVFRCKKRWSYSAVVGFEYAWRHIYDCLGIKEPQLETSPVLLIMGKANRNWIAREWFHLYSSAGLGVQYVFYNGVYDASPSILFVPIGVTFGKKLFGFAEIGGSSLFLGGMFGIGYRF